MPLATSISNTCVMGVAWFWVVSFCFCSTRAGGGGGLGSWVFPGLFVFGRLGFLVLGGFGGSQGWLLGI